MRSSLKMWSGRLLPLMRCIQLVLSLSLVMGFISFIFLRAAFLLVWTVSSERIASSMRRLGTRFLNLLRGGSN